MTFRELHSPELELLAKLEDAYPGCSVSCFPNEQDGGYRAKITLRTGSYCVSSGPSRAQAIQNAIELAREAPGFPGYVDTWPADWRKSAAS